MGMWNVPSVKQVAQVAAQPHSDQHNDVITELLLLITASVGCVSSYKHWCRLSSSSWFKVHFKNDLGKHGHQCTLPVGHSAGNLGGWVQERFMHQHHHVSEFAVGRAGCKSISTPYSPCLLYLHMVKAWQGDIKGLIRLSWWSAYSCFNLFFQQHWGEPNVIKLYGL